MLSDIALGFQVSPRVGRLMDEGRLAQEMVLLVKRSNVGKRSTSPVWRPAPGDEGPELPLGTGSIPMGAGTG